jgi:MipA family protein
MKTKNIHCRLALALVTLTALIAGNAIAQSPSTTELKPEWELGVVGFGLSQQAYPGSSYQVKAGVISPAFVYRGKWLRLNENGLGFRAIDEPNFELDLSLAGSLGSNSSKVPARQGMPNLGYLVEFGPAAKWYMYGKNSAQKLWWELPVRSVHNLSSKAKNVGFTIEPQLRYDLKQSQWRFWASAGVLLGDQKMNQYLYGVEEPYVTTKRSAYHAKAGLVNAKASVSTSFSITDRLSTFGSVRYNSVSGASNSHSPLIDQTKGINYGIGLLYYFAQSDNKVAP